MRVGYARVSTNDQNLDLQLIALRKAGCDKIYSDLGISGAGFSRPGLQQALNALNGGCTLVVWRLDRLGRSLPSLIHLVEELGRRDVDFQSLTESIDTRSSGGRLIFHMMAALAEFERSLISERTRAGMEAARMNGKHLGRPRALSMADIVQARRALSSGTPPQIVADTFGVSSRTLRRYLRTSEGYH